MKKPKTLSLFAGFQNAQIPINRNISVREMLLFNTVCIFDIFWIDSHAVQNNWMTN